MTELSSLLRREQDPARGCRRVAAFACTVIALAAFPSVVKAAEPRPDASTGPVSTGLQPDAFPGTATAKPEALAPIGGSLGAPLTTPSPAAPKLTPTAAKIHVAPVTRPVVIAPVTRAPADTRVVHPQAKPHARTAKQRALIRMQLPTVVRGSLRLPASLRVPVESVQTVAKRRDLVPAAFALLALVATSGCLLTVAARSRREELES